MQYAFAPINKGGGRAEEYRAASSELDACDSLDDCPHGGIVCRVPEVWEIAWESGVSILMPEIPPLCSAAEALERAQARQDEHEEATGERDTAVLAQIRLGDVEYDFGAGYRRTEGEAREAWLEWLATQRDELAAERIEGARGHGKH